MQPSAFSGHACRALAGQFAKFGAVGIGNTLLSLLVFAVLSRVGLGGAAGAALAFAAGAVNGYVWNRRWTFAAADSGRARRRYAGVQLAGLGATSGLMALLSAGGVVEIVAYLTTVAIVTVSTFAANRQWVFAGRSNRASRLPGTVTATPQAGHRVRQEWTRRLEV